MVYEMASYDWMISPCKSCAQEGRNCPGNCVAYMMWFPKMWNKLCRILREKWGYDKERGDEHECEGLPSAAEEAGHDDPE